MPLQGAWAAVRNWWDHLPEEIQTPLIASFWIACLAIIWFS